MSNTTSRIKRFLIRLKEEEIFSTGDLLALGTRSSVDKALSRLVKTGAIHRLTHGLFIKSSHKTIHVSVETVAEHKAARFNNRIIKHGQDLAYNLSLTPEANLNPTFASSGSSGSFLFNGTTRIYFKHTTARQAHLNESKIGNALRAIWHLGSESYSPLSFKQLNHQLGRSDRQQLPRCPASFKC